MSGCRCQPTTGAAAGTDGTPGHQLLGRGRISQVLAWEAGWVLKLFAPQVGREEVEREFGATRLAHRLGAPAPEVREVVEYLGRLGMVCRRVEGATLLQRPAALLRSGGRLAALHAYLHRLAGSGLSPQRQRLQWQILRAPLLSDYTRRVALRVLEELPDGDRLCHGDFHPGNVMLEGKCAMVIDWHDASRGNPAADVARTWLLLRTAHWQYRGVQRLAIGLTAWWVFRRYLEAYEELVPGTRQELYRWRLPVAVARLSEGVAGVEGPLAELAERLARLAG